VKDANGIVGSSITYVWKADGEILEGEVSNTLTLTQAHVGKQISVEVSFDDELGNKEVVTSFPTPPINEEPDPAEGSLDILGVPQIELNGTEPELRVVNTIIDEDGIVESTAVYQWLRNGIAVIGQTGTTYDLTDDDALSRIQVVYSYVDKANNVEVIRSNPTPLILQSNAIATRIGGTGSTTEFVTTDVEIANSFIAEDVGLSLKLDQLADLAAQVTALQGRLGQLLEIADDVSTDDSESVKGFSETLANALQTEGSLTKTLNMQSLDFSDVANSEAKLAFSASQDDDEITSLVIDLGMSARELVVDGVEFLSIKGAATVRGGEGSNTFLGDGASQDVMMGADDDMLSAGGGNDTVGSAGGNDTISGGSGDDLAFGGTGNDSVAGDTGNDHILDSWGTDTLNGGEGNDVIRSFDGGDKIYAQWGNDTVYGGRGDDFIKGGDGNDVLYGDTVLFSSRGDDTLTGGAGDDLLQGGYGADTFVFNAGTDGNDTIGRIGGGADFESGLDHVQLVGFSEVNGTNVMDAISDISGQAVFDAEGITITFDGILKADLSADDFIF